MPFRCNLSFPCFRGIGTGGEILAFWAYARGDGRLIDRGSIPMPLFTLRLQSHGKALRRAVLFALGLGVCLPLAPAQSRIAAEELTNRKAKVEEARELLALGDQAMAGQQPAQALEAYAGAFELVPEVPALSELREAATQRYVAAALSQSAALANRGDLVAAKQVLEQVLVKDVAPDHPEVLKMKAMLNDPVRVNPALTPRHHDNVGRVLDLIEKANGAISLGRFDLAKECYEEILRIDPHNVLARRGLEQVVKLKDSAHEAAFDQARAEMLLEVDQAWELSHRAPRAPEPELTDGGGDSGSGRTIEAKLRQIVIPRLALDQVSLRDAIEFLRLTSSREDLDTIDQTQRGINFTIDLGPEDSPVVQKIENQRFDLKLSNVPVLQVLQYINELTGTSYVVDQYSVIIRPRGQTSDELFIREYSTPPDFISALSEGGGGGEAERNPFEQPTASQGLISERLSVQELLNRKGVSFPEGASASYSAATNMLRVSNTADNHSVISQIVDAIHEADPVIVSVQVTMIQTQQKNLTELGFDWLLTPFDMGQGAFLGGGTAGNAGGRTVADFSGALAIPGSADAVVQNGVVTNGLRSGDRGFVADSIDEIINNPSRQAQTARVAPGILSLTGIFSDGEAQLMMRGLDQNEGVDIMARPSVITRSGESSKIQLVREFIYPTEYDPPELQSGGGGQSSNNIAFPVVPANPTAFEMREVGITLEVLPVAGEDKNYISVMLNPEIVEFDGFVNFGSPITVPVEDPLGGITRATLTNNEILMPVFSTKRATSQLTVADGATIAYGGLLSQNIQTLEDKVPVLGDIPLLGRLFRTETNLPISTAIVFLVRVELMDPTGRRYRDLKTP